MFEFRRTSVTNDRFLREQDKPSITDICKIKLEAGEPLEPKAFCPHPTVQDLYTRYPKLKLPTICLKSDIDPYVSLQMDHVEKYFKVRNLDFIKYTKLALRPQTVAKKKTTRVPPNVSTSDGNKMTQVIFNEALSSLRVPPIKINQGDSEYHETTTKNSADKDANKVSDSTKDYKKRKYSEVDLTPKDQNFKKLSTVETLTVVPKVNVLSSTTLYMCDICNAVQSTAKYLRKHRNKHLRCQFCKKKCETLDNKQHHIRNTCLVKKCLNSSPDVELTKVECDTSIRRKYPNAFTEFPQLKNICSDIEIASTSNSLASRDIDSKQSNITDYPTVIEILSDDEETIPASNIIDNVNLQNIANASNGKQKSTSSDSSVPVVVEKLHSTISVVKPDIRIKG
ncbi:hypothetical protein NQ317_000090 [Molorchus minor]|uniref:C2H2-type domain-containing protein n=1 Tax=Molorchus minor TaxID=1323400 RepID=A0ABQ9IXH3_9CUCU|nr:hypothetical protein NQ317_000090 [Molorchus minor]